MPVIPIPSPTQVSPVGNRPRKEGLKGRYDASKGGTARIELATSRTFALFSGETLCRAASHGEVEWKTVDRRGIRTENPPRTVGETDARWRGKSREGTRGRTGCRRGSAFCVRRGRCGRVGVVPRRVRLVRLCFVEESAHVAHLHFHFDAMSRAPDNSSTQKNTVPLVRTVGFDLEAERLAAVELAAEDPPATLETAASLSPVRIPPAIFKKQQQHSEESERYHAEMECEEEDANESHASDMAGPALEETPSKESKPTQANMATGVAETVVYVRENRMHPSGSMIANAISGRMHSPDLPETQGDEAKAEKHEEKSVTKEQEKVDTNLEATSGTTTRTKRKEEEEKETAESRPAREKEEETDPSKKGTKKKLTRAERREIQERQRAAKAEAKAATAAGGGSGKATAKKGTSQPAPDSSRTSSLAEKGAEVEKPKEGSDDKKKVEKILKKGLIPQNKAVKIVELFSHIRQVDEEALLSSLMEVGLGSSVLHPDVVEIGLQYADGTVVGGTARCFTMLTAFRKMILSYGTPSGKQFSRDLTAKLNTNIQFLTRCRPLSASMGNAIRWLKLQVANIDPALSDETARNVLVGCINQYIHEKIVFAKERIVELGLSKIEDGDVILTYAFSYIVLQLLLAAQAAGRQFSVIVVDSRPHNEGQELLRRLLKEGVKCVYTHINASPYVMKDATKVFVGASAILANGAVISRAGTAAIACAADVFGLPVMVCCESNKFHERVQLDSITSNELGDPGALVQTRVGSDPNLRGWEDVDNLYLLNLKYDAMQAEFVTMIITEFGLVPPTSVPVILREYRTDPF